MLIISGFISSWLKVLPNHLGFDFNLVEGLATIDSNDATLILGTIIMGAH